MLYAFEMTVAAAEMLQRLADENNLNEEQRVDLLLYMAERGLVTRVSATERTRDEYIADLSKHFNVLDLEKGGLVCAAKKQSKFGGLFGGLKKLVMPISSTLKRLLTSLADWCAGISLSE